MQKIYEEIRQDLERKGNSEQSCDFSVYFCQSLDLLWQGEADTVAVTVKKGKLGHYIDKFHRLMDALIRGDIQTNFSTLFISFAVVTDEPNTHKLKITDCYDTENYVLFVEGTEK